MLFTYFDVSESIYSVADHGSKQTYLRMGIFKLELPISRSDHLPNPFSAALRTATKRPLNAQAGG